MPEPKYITYRVTSTTETITYDAWASELLNLFIFRIVLHSGDFYNALLKCPEELEEATREKRPKKD